ncbi:MAG TPA: DUF4129 domain-containing protein [Albitalea sp.]
MDTGTRRADPRAVLSVVLVLVAAAVVAIAATGRSLLVPALDLAEGAALLRFAGAAAAAAGVAALLLLRRRLPFTPEPRADPAAGALVTAATIMAVLAAVALFAPRERLASEPAPPPAESAAGEPRRDRPDVPSSRTARPFQMEFGFGAGRESPGAGGGGVTQPAELDPVGEGSGLLARIARILLPVLLLVLLFLALRSLRGRGMRAAGAAGEPAIAPADAEAGLEASLDEIMLENGEPAERITAAYYRLLRALSTAGAPRRAHEAPHEHLNRALGTLGVQPEPMHRLAALYVAAQFGTHPMTERDRAEAARALEDALAGLRAAHRLPAGAGVA